MRRLVKFLLIVWIAIFVLVVLYAFVPPAKALMDRTIMPPINDALGGLVTAITSSMIWQQYIIPFPNQLIIGAIILGFPIAYLFHKSFNRVRKVFVRSAASESGAVVYTEPVSTPSYTPQPQQTTTTTPPAQKQEPAPTQTPLPEKEAEG